MSDWVLHHGDCLDPVTGLASLADRSIDHVITDPPYEAEAHTLQRREKPAGWRKAGGSSVIEAPLNFDAITSDQRAAMASQIARVSRGCAVVFCQVEAVQDWRIVLNASGIKYRRTIPWTKPDAMPSLHGRWPGQAFEAIVLAMHSSAPPCPIGGKARRYEIPKAGGNGVPHPTAKPLDLMLTIVEDFTRPGDLVLDPFAGSGTTGLACRILGRRFIGWEKDSNYHEVAMRRIGGAEVTPRPEQPSLFR